MPDESKWFQTGFKVAQDIAKAREDRQNQTGDQRRFWLKVGTERDIIFLDNFKLMTERAGRECEAVPFIVAEHQLDIDQDWHKRKFVTCVGSGCLCCEKKMKKVSVGVLSVLDVTPFTDQGGQKITRPEKKIFAAVSNALVLLNAKRAKRDGNLVGCRYSVARHEQRTPRVGGDFEFVEKHDDLKAKYPGLNLDPYGFSAEQTVAYYMKLLAPPSREELEQIFREHNVTDGANFKGTTPTGTGAPKDDSESIKY